MPDWVALHPGITLFLVATILYVSDAVRLLYVNEVLFLQSVSGRWRARVAPAYPRVASRYLAWPPLLRPQAPVVRSTWPGSATITARQSCDEGDVIEATQQGLGFLRYQSVFLLVLIFGALPALYWAVSPVSFLAGVGVAYLDVLVLTAWLARRRHALGLSKAAVTAMSLESLVCLPLAINLFRKVQERRLQETTDPLRLADKLLETEDRTEFLGALARIVREQAEWVAEDSERRRQLLAFGDQIRIRSAR